MTLQREELEQWIREDTLQEGEQWFLVATEWWRAAFPPAASVSEDDDDLMDGNANECMESTNDSTANKSNKLKVCNASLVDVAYSSEARRSVVLKPQLAEERDYRLVSERVWNRLSHEYGADWIIEREVIAHGPTRQLRVEVYPTMFQLSYWHSDMETPQVVEIVEDPQQQQPHAFVILAGAAASLSAIEQQIQHALLPRLHEFFPNIAPQDVQQALQLCYREAQQAPWTPLVDAAVSAGVTCVGDLHLDPRDYKDGDKRFHELLIEAKFTPPTTATAKDWRKGFFYSEILANTWRFELVVNQLVDANDTDNRWYESRVVDLNEDKVKVHFRGWTPKWDEWLPRMSPRLARLHTKVPNWRNFKVGDDVQVGFNITGRSYPEWRNATVVQVSRTADTDADADVESAHTTPTDGQEDGTNKLQVLVKYDGREKWMPAQDELLCRFGTHKATNAVNAAKPKIANRPQLSNSSYYNDRRDYSYEYGKGKPAFVGVVGLQNLGNTCFMNSMLQCLNNAKPLKDYFLARDRVTGEPRFEKDVNESNPLGMKGMIAREFAKLVTKMWGNEYATVSPTGLKSVIGQYAPQFAGYQQQDSQEVMNFILDGLHEDLNRVKTKPYTEPVKRNGRNDDEVAQDEWAQYLRRNDSVIVENFMGQLRSHVTCSNVACGHESVTFDPFMNLSVPIPTDESVAVKVQLFWANGDIPTKYGVRVDKDATIQDVKEKLSELAKVRSARLFFVEVRAHKIKKPHADTTPIDELMEDILHAYELEFPVSEYAFSSSSLTPPSALIPTITASGTHDEVKPMQLITLLHQAPVASPVDSSRHGDDGEDGDYNGNGHASMDQNRAYGPKQRRVEVELFNTPLLLSIDSHSTKEQVHQKVWQVVKRLVANDSSYGCDDSTQMLPYRLHITQPNGASAMVRDFPRTSEPAELPPGCGGSTASIGYSFTLEWSRKGYQQGYDEKAAKRIELHESLRQLRISSSPASATSSSSSDGVSLENCLTKFTEREQLGKTDTWYCPKCKEHVRAFKKFDLFQLPRVVIFHLKRFRYAQSSFYMHRDKINTLVSFPIASLDLGSFVVGPQRDEKLMYDLFAVSEHSGGLGGGHYTAVGKNPENHKWYSYNDSFTKEASAQDAVTSRAYVLFYVRRE